MRFKMEDYQNRTKLIGLNPVSILVGYIRDVLFIFWRIILYPWERLFLSEKTLQDDLDRLDSELASRQPVDPRIMPDLEVADMNSNQLTVHIKEQTGRPRRSVSESGEDIEVVHEKQVPHIPGILKKRSVSESSDDLNSPSYNRQCSSSSPISESDENPECTSSDERERKKSVSFNDHVQSATFKGSAPVASMRQVLKSKRRKARKAEKLRQGRRRRNSNSTSEPSSDDAPGTPEADPETPDYDAGASERNTENIGDSEERPKKDEQKHESVKQSLEKTIRVNEETKGANKKQHEEGDTSESVQAPSDITAHEVHTKRDDVTQNGDVHTEGSDERTKTNYDSDDYDEKEGAAAEKEAANQAKAPPSADIPDADPEAPETMLSWSERPADPLLMPICAVPLSNDVMFDLDVD